ncbi:right-handed parallel beta-helix repeat-containing protein [Novosphingobium umbonatum]|uniref:Right-handed parallel beta-helix repeat-containing protein n=1 Tax=Novosphingobium umbonatum TaxID=1908524 RepID=A0A437N4V0_9SPHN|nr:right-handed parallel beta-helix repeat-containing protein [Novosphingobium umbonatum]RVU04944.1 right-handed parallel beta-helix repeat-containing protein [Novosphingobium umbonatum]
MKRALIPLALIAAGPAQAQTSKPYLVVESGQRFDRLQAALNAIGDRSATIRIAEGTWRDCGVQTSGNVTYAAATLGKSVLQSQLCESKAALVLRGRSARVEGLIFSNYGTQDGNGAGIRLEQGNLLVSQSWFRNSEEGILAGNDAKGQIIIDRSTFTHLGRCDRGLACAHSVYIGFYDKVTITNSRFEAGDGGHYIKTRSAKVDIRDNVIDDTAGRASNYLIDLPAGATGRISGNWMVQGAHKENGSTIIAVAAESRDHVSDGLVIEGNSLRLAAGANSNAVFVRDWQGGRLMLGANQLPPAMVRYKRQ